METQKDFAAQVAADEAAKKHAEEIKQTRVGGLGGSDAALVLKIGKQGMAALSATDHKRLAVMLGLLKQDDWSGNAYTNAGHQFEEFTAQYIQNDGGELEREKFITRDLARTFKCFAHADFADAQGNIIECKFVQATTQAVASRYAAQLQWYYMLGAKSVNLFHGVGDAEPFEVQETWLLPIERDEDAINFLHAGLQTLDNAIAAGWKPEVTDKCEYGDTPEIVQHAFDRLLELKKQERALEEQRAEIVAILKTYCEDFEIANIKNPENHAQVIYKKAGISRTFDAKKFAADHPELDLGKYYKTSTVSASISLKL